MKKITLLLFFLILSACSSSKNGGTSRPLYEILTEQNTGGASIQFYETLTEPNEIKMLFSDPNLKNKIHEDDIQRANFVILNLGEKDGNGYRIAIQKVEETPNQIVITVTEKSPAVKSQAIEKTTPYSILKINSKKEILFK